MRENVINLTAEFPKYQILGKIFKHPIITNIAIKYFNK